MLNCWLPGCTFVSLLCLFCRLSTNEQVYGKFVLIKSPSITAFAAHIQNMNVHVD